MIVVVGIGCWGQGVSGDVLVTEQMANCVAVVAHVHGTAIMAHVNTIDPNFTATFTRVRDLLLRGVAGPPPGQGQVRFDVVLGNLWQANGVLKTALLQAVQHVFGIAPANLQVSPNAAFEVNGQHFTAYTPAFSNEYARGGPNRFRGNSI